MSTTGSTYFAEKLAAKDETISSLQSAFDVYKAKQRNRYDQLRKEVAFYFKTNGPNAENEASANLAIRLAECEHELDLAQNEASTLKSEMEHKNNLLGDYSTKVKKLEEQLAELTARSASMPDIEAIHQQLIYKDERIIELNNEILAKERKILDLQETCREQGEVASVKTQAMRIYQKKFEEFETKSVRDIGTETDPIGHSERRRDLPGTSRVSRHSSPGHAVSNRQSTGNGSPPPLDPSETEGFVKDDDEFDFSRGSLNLSEMDLDNEGSYRRKQRRERKKVTFDLPPSTSQTQGIIEQYELHLSKLTDEANELKRQMTDMNVANYELKARLEEVMDENSRMSREYRNANLKSKAVAQSRVRELEELLADTNTRYSQEIGQLEAELETLRSTRDWEVEENGILRQQNAQLSQQLADLKERNHKLTTELDASEQSNRELHVKREEQEIFVDNLIEELSDAETIVVYMEDQKHSILDDVDGLKDALIAQDKYIEVLEADVIIYEEHVGILRESLGASKVDHRSLIRSKAFETKLSALEKEKDQITRKSKEDRLQTKALSQKVKVLEQENEKLMEKLCEKEMNDQHELVEELQEEVSKLREDLHKSHDHHTQVEDMLRKNDEEKSREINKLMGEVQNLRIELNDQQSSSLQVEQLQNQASIDAKEETIRSLTEQLDAVQCNNFVLKQELEKAKEDAENQYDMMVEKLRETSINFVAATENNDELEAQVSELCAQLQVELAKVQDLEKDKGESTKQVDDLKSQLDSVKLQLEKHKGALKKTEENKEELVRLREELELERKRGQDKWDEVCKLMFENDSNAESRKNSMEVQNQQYVLAFEEKIRDLEDQVKSAHQTIAQLEKVAAEKANQVEQVFVQQTVQVQESTPLQAASNHEASQELEELRKRVEELELECRLSGELNVELGRAMLDMEKEKESRSGESETLVNEKEHLLMELHLHEMIEEEMNQELENAKQQNEMLTQQLARSQVEKLEPVHDYTEVTQEDQPSNQETPIINSLPEESVPQQRDLVTENLILRECVDNSVKAQEDISEDVNKLLELKTELETAVQALQGEIWTLNGKLKASVIDRENMEDKISELDAKCSSEKRRADLLDSDLAEQVELTEKATRQAAEAENESNRRICEMEAKSAELQQAYATLTTYYNQLQEAYNALYAQLANQSSQPEQAENQQSTSRESSPLTEEVSRNIDLLIELLDIDVDGNTGVQEKIQMITEIVRKKVQEVSLLTSAIEEQKTQNEALCERLEKATKDACLAHQLDDLKAELEWKEEEIQSLTRKTQELQQALDEVIEKSTEEQALATSRLRTDLAILAAKLATRQADVDSLFRTNAELAYTNVDLQNQLDEQQQQQQQQVQQVEEQQQEQQVQQQQQTQEGELQQLHVPRIPRLSIGELRAWHRETGGLHPFLERRHLQQIQRRLQGLPVEEEEEEEDDDDDDDELELEDEPQADLTADELADLRAQLEETERRLEQMITESMAMDGVVERQAQQVTQLENRLGEAEAIAQEYTKKYVDTKDESDAKDNEILQLKDECEALHKDIADLTVKNAELSQLIEASQHVTASDDMDAVVQDLKSTIVDRDDQIEDLKLDFQNKDEEVTSIKTMLSEKKEQYEQLMTENVRLQQQVEELTQQVEHVEQQQTSHQQQSTSQQQQDSDGWGESDDWGTSEEVAQPVTIQETLQTSIEESSYLQEQIDMISHENESLIQEVHQLRQQVDQANQVIDKFNVTKTCRGQTTDENMQNPAEPSDEYKKKLISAYLKKKQKERKSVQVGTDPDKELGQLKKELEESQKMVEGLMKKVEAEEEEKRQRVEQQKPETEERGVVTDEALLPKASPAGENLRLLEEARHELTRCQDELARIASRLSSVEKQNSLLKESEGRLLDSLDTTNRLLECKKAEIEQLQKQLNTVKSASTTTSSTSMASSSTSVASRRSVVTPVVARSTPSPSASRTFHSPNTSITVSSEAPIDPPAVFIPQANIIRRRKDVREN